MQIHSETFEAPRAYAEDYHHSAKIKDILREQCTQYRSRDSVLQLKIVYRMVQVTLRSPVHCSEIAPTVTTNFTPCFTCINNYLMCILPDDDSTGIETLSSL